MTPAISIITPLYNKERYIAETIQSILSQSFQNWEMLIVDNLSTDNSFLIAQNFKDPRIRFFQCHKQGPGATRNLGIYQSKAKWIQFLDGDDLLEPDHLKHQLEVAKSHPNVDIVVSCWQKFTDAQPNQKVLLKPAGMGQTSQDLRDSAIAYTPWAPHAALVKRSILLGDYLWPESLDQYLAEDTAFWFRLVNSYNVEYNDKAGALYRAGVAESRTDFDPEKWFEGNHAAIRANITYLKNNSIELTPGQIAFLVQNYSGLYLHAHQTNSKRIQFCCTKEIDAWLNLYFQINSNPKTTMILRRFLGIKLYLALTTRSPKLVFSA